MLVSELEQVTLEKLHLQRVRLKNSNPPSGLCPTLRLKANYLYNNMYEESVGVKNHQLNLCSFSQPVVRLPGCSFLFWSSLSEKKHFIEPVTSTSSQ